MNHDNKKTLNQSNYNKQAMAVVRYLSQFIIVNEHKLLPREEPKPPFYLRCYHSKAGELTELKGRVARIFTPRSILELMLFTVVLSSL